MYVSPTPPSPPPSPPHPPPPPPSQSPPPPPSPPPPSQSPPPPTQQSPPPPPNSTPSSTWPLVTLTPSLAPSSPSAQLSPQPLEPSIGAITAPLSSPPARPSMHSFSRRARARANDLKRDNKIPPEIIAQPYPLTSLSSPPPLPPPHSLSPLPMPKSLSEPSPSQKQTLPRDATKQSEPACTVRIKNAILSSSFFNRLAKHSKAHQTNVNKESRHGSPTIRHPEGRINLKTISARSTTFSSCSKESTYAQTATPPPKDPGNTDELALRPLNPTAHLMGDFRRKLKEQQTPEEQQSRGAPSQTSINESPDVGILQVFFFFSGKGFEKGGIKQE